MLAVVFSGRSNVGKSSLINHLTGIKNLARTSSTPGKTQQIFQFSTPYGLFVDLPGYGFAKASKTKQATWGREIEHYLENNPQIALIVQLLDIRHPPSPEDLQMIDWCVSRCLPTLFVLTKLDKIPSTKQHSTIQAFTKTLEQFVENPAVIAYTIKDAQCQKRLLTLIQKALS